MKIGGLQKTSLLDYPDIISVIIWTTGCNFKCPFCYNGDLVTGKSNSISEVELFSFLEKRKNVLEGIVISGGEPLLQKDIKEFCKKVKKLGYLIKIDTNGMFPDELKELIDNKLVDYIAMDVKAPKNKYSKLSGVKTNISNIEKSINLIKNNMSNYEFKTTFIPQLLEKKDIVEIAKWLKGSKKYYLQQFKQDTKLLEPQLEQIKPYPKQYLEETLKEIQSYFKNCYIRGI